MSDEVVYWVIFTSSILFSYAFVFLASFYLLRIMKSTPDEQSARKKLADALYGIATGHVIVLLYSYFTIKVFEFHHDEKGVGLLLFPIFSLLFFVGPLTFVTIIFFTIYKKKRASFLKGTLIGCLPIVPFIAEIIFG